MLDGLFRPRAVAVIGASANPYSIGHIVIKNLSTYGFKGPNIAVVTACTTSTHNIGLAATRDPELAARIADVTARETRASGIRWNFDPVMDIGRNPLWSRFEETFGEDSYLAGVLGSAVIVGALGLDVSTVVLASAVPGAVSTFPTLSVATV